MADNISVKDGAGATVVLASKEVASVQYPKRITVDSTGTEVAVATAAKQDTQITSLASIDGHVDGLETLLAATNALLTTQAGYLDGLETLITSSNSTLTTQSGYLDGIEALLGTGNTSTGSLVTLLTALSKAEDAAHVSGDVGIQMLTVRKDTPVATAGTDGEYQPPVSGADGRLHVAAASDRLIAATATTLTRPANTTAYAALDSISDNGTAGSVTALPVTVSDTNDAPVAITFIELDTNDTGLAAAGQVRVYVYNSDPTASSGVGAGDNAAFSNKRAGLRGTFVGTFRAMSDGGKAICIPEDGQPYLISLPGSGAKTLWYQIQAITAFTPSANSTTIIPTFKGFQGRA